MKVDIRDREALGAIDPSAFAAYLRTRGWQQHAEPGANWVAFTYQDFEITLPLTTELRDFVTRIAEAVRTLETVEGRDQLQIFADLSAASGRTDHLGALNQAARVVTATSDTEPRVGTRSDSSTLLPKVKVPRRKVPRFEIPPTSRILEFPDEFVKLLSRSGFSTDCIEVVYSEIAKVVEWCRRPAFPFLMIKEQRGEFTAIVQLACQLRDRWYGISLEYRSDLRTSVPEQLNDFITEVEGKIHRLTYESSEDSVDADLVRAYGHSTDVSIEEVALRMSEVGSNPRGHELRGEQSGIQRRLQFLNDLTAIWFRFHPGSEDRPIVRNSSEDTYHGPLLDFVLSVADFERIVIPGRESSPRKGCNIAKDLMKMAKAMKKMKAMARVEMP